jgi:lipopolysaccharide/colanic/teichoic acid biosynthesis glycosyltransferase
MRVGSDRDGTRSAAILRHIKDDEPIQKAVNRANVTRVGAFIRKWAIDEIPQLFNVLKGDMSLVGPRPVPRADYEAEDPWQKKRFDIKPGCTGLWKLFASRDHIPFSHTALYDIYYARNMSLAMDVYILLGTVRVVLTGRADV